MSQATRQSGIKVPVRDLLRPERDAKSSALFPNMEPISLSTARPILCIVVDAEEEFHWGRPVSALNNTTVSVRHQKRAHEIFACYDACPTYLVTYPIATDPAASGVLREYLADGRCDVGAQLHPWVTPPFDQQTDERLSFPGNLPAGTEREKLRRLAGAVWDGFGLQPTAYKAGRYGLGPATAGLLEAEGFQVDTSLIPRTSYARVGGPDFSSFDYGPFWFGARRRLLELPVTRALTGLLARTAPSLYALSEHRMAGWIRAGGLLARGRLLERITLSPEGSDLSAMCRLCRTLLARGERILTLSYHSPSLEPGNTPYVRDQRDLAIFLDRLSGFLDFFCSQFNGEILTLREAHTRLAGISRAPAAPALAPTVQAHFDGFAADSASWRAPGITRSMSALRNNPGGGIGAASVSGAAGEPGPRGPRCLLVANTFPPVHGGSAIVYDSLARFGGGRVSVLAPQQDYRDGGPIQGWREFDRHAPFKVHRIPMLRTRFLPHDAGLLQRIGGLVRDLLIRLATLRAIRRIVRSEDIAILCIGELIAGGWLAKANRWPCSLKTLIYTHGEEISTRTDYDEGGQRRRRAVASADGIVAVSRFTRDALVCALGVPPSKVELISNGVDLARFYPTPRLDHLVDRYGLRDKRVLLTVGRLYARKGMDRVIESLNLVRHRIDNVCYLIVGEGAYRPALEALVAQHGLVGHVIFAGAVADYDLVTYYALGDVFIMANREMSDGDTEGFGLVFLEANACGLPVIAGMAGGSVDAVTDRRNGLVVDGEDPIAIAAAITRLFEDDALCQSLRAGGFVVANEASWHRQVEQFLGFCDRIARGDIG